MEVILDVLPRFVPEVDWLAWEARRRPSMFNPCLPLDRVIEDNEGDKLGLALEID